MRTVSTLIATPSTMEPAGKSTFSPAESFSRTTWHSPAPYLFVGLAAMLGLIAFALVLLACSYWKISGEAGAGGDDLESGAGEKSAAGDLLKLVPIDEEKIVVIMAGDLNPSFLATPIYSNKSCLFGDENGKFEKKLEMEKGELSDEKVKEEVIIEVISNQNHEDTH